MFKANTYLYQVCGIILLLCAYLFSNTPDSLSDMHFNLSHHTVMAASSDEACPDSMVPPTKISSKHDAHHKWNVQKHISFYLLIPVKAVSFHFVPELAQIDHKYMLTEAYKYLYYEEINPPPPKQQLKAYCTIA